MSKEINPEHMDESDVEYVRQRPFLRQEFILQGFGDPLDPDYPGLVGNDDEDEGDEDGDDEQSEEQPGEDDEKESDEDEDEAPMPWSESMTKEQLREVIASRNAGYEDDEQIEPDGDKKPDLIAALKNDDEELAASDE